MLQARNGLMGHADTLLKDTFFKGSIPMSITCCRQGMGHADTLASLVHIIIERVNLLGHRK